MAQKAKRALAHIEERRQRIAGLERRLNRMRAAALQPGRSDDETFRHNMQAQQKQLRQMTATPETADAIDYTLGLTLLALDRPFAADRTFGRVLKRRPAFGLYQSIGRLKETTRHAWTRALLQGTAWAVLTGFWMAATVGTGWSRPWRWVRWQHLTACLIALLAWIAVYQAVLHWPGHQESAAGFVNRDGFYPTPTYVHTRPGTPESEVAGRLFNYGLTAVGSIFLLAVATAGIRQPGRRCLINGLGGLLLGMALMTQFYYAHCENRSRLYRRNATAAAWLSAQLAFRSSEPEPYLLTDPQAYAGVELASISDPLLVEWLERHLPDARRQPEQRRID
jgi:hypothetical protein